MKLELVAIHAAEGRVVVVEADDEESHDADAVLLDARDRILVRREFPILPARCHSI